MNIEHIHEFVSESHWLHGIVVFCKHCGLDPETAQIRDAINRNEHNDNP